MRTFRIAVAATMAFFALTCTVPASDLSQSFQKPPDEAKPFTWWHWIDGNVTKSGITGDLEAMQRAGLGGCYLFSIGGYFPKGPAVFGTPGWYDLLTHTVNEAERLGLVFGVHNCDGWSESGGPWITPETSMKELTYTRLDVEGPKKLEETLAVPEHRENFYRDIALVAFPLPAGGRLNDSTTKVSGTIKDCQKLSDGKAATRGVFPQSASGHQIELALPEAKVIRSMVFHNVNGYGGDEDLPVTIEASLDGKNWTPSGNCSFAWDTAEGKKPITVAFDALNARWLRISFTNNWEVQIGEIELSDAARVHFAEAKAAWLRTRGHGGESRNLRLYPGPDRHRSIPADRVIEADKVVVLRSNMDTGGRVTWDVPPGRWRILRVGYTSNGRRNKPATDQGRGLECDKLDPKVVRFHMDQYVGRLVQLFGPRTGKVFKVVETDSWECDVQNWTAGFENRFRSKVGFDLLPWMPALLEGWIVESADASDRVLWDWRRFLADQFSESYFKPVSDYLEKRGLTYVCEGSGRQMYNYDAIGYQRAGDIPMGEFWLNTGPGQGVRVDNKVAASVAHIAGKKVVASESYTSSSPFARWQNHPYSLKPMGDRAFCAGVNQFVFHTFSHQPYEVTGPGFTMGIWGLNCNRANTWWEPGRAWMKYLTRCNHLLREGHFAADVLSFVGEDVPNRIGWRNELVPQLPAGYDFDGCDDKALLEAKVKGGRILLPSGMEYRVLLLPDKTTMRPALLKKIGALVKSGAVVVGPAPRQSPSAAGSEKADRTIQQLAKEIWGACDGDKVKEHGYGAGRVFWGLSFEEVFKRLDLAPDFEADAASDAEILYIHRRIENAECYFVANQKSRPEQITARFRVKDRQPELWDPVTGNVSYPGVFKPSASGLEMPLTLDPAGSVFVIFRDKLPARYVRTVAAPGVDFEVVPDVGLTARAWQAGAATAVLNDGSKVNVSGSNLPQGIDLTGAWNVTFPPGLGAPSSAVFDNLVSYTQRSEPGIRYFSGTATYSKEFDLPESLAGQDREVWLDLGAVQVIAEVRLNGKDLGILWKPPFRINATQALKPGKNRVEIRVTNLWPNRLIGDEQMPDSIKWHKVRSENLPAVWPEWLLEGKPRPDGRVVFCTRKPYGKNDPLFDSGLIGPVRLVPAIRTRL